jgi:hypothetical protein
VHDPLAWPYRWTQKDFNLRWHIILRARSTYRAAVFSSPRSTAVGS